jgi:nitrogen fixation/metabolism regulation signal transduction histidine kinase
MAPSFLDVSLRKKVAVVFLVIFLVVSFGGGLALYRADGVVGLLQLELPPKTEVLVRAAHLNSLAQIIHYYDEELTQSARNYAFTGQAKWKTRYQEAAPILDRAIKDAISGGGAEDAAIFAGINQTNIDLVTLEEKSLSLVDQGKKSEAITVLESSDYWGKKAIYHGGLDKYLEFRGAKEGEALNVSAKGVDSIIQDVRSQVTVDLVILIVALAIILALLILAFLFVRSILLGPLDDLNHALKKVADGDLSQEIKMARRDEIGRAINSFNLMIRELKESRFNVEKKVTERTMELEQVNNVMVGRELKMIELKKELEELRRKAK